MKPIVFGFALLLIAAGASAQNNDWPKAIAAVERVAAEYIDYGLKNSGSSSIQQAVGVVGLTADVEKHRCAILGRMLGRVEVIAELERFDYPPLSQDPDPFQAVEIGVSLDNWVWQAKTALEQSEAERINTWNLDCVGTLVPATEGIVSERPEAVVSDDGHTLTIYGNIDAGFFERFMAALNAAPTVKEISLGSGGGSVKDALLAGQEIRARGLDTVLFGNCYSACPLVFVGGVNRTLWANVRNDFGFHRLATRDGTALPDDHAIYGLIGDYLSEMGVDAPTYIGWMQSADPSAMYSPEPWDLCEPGVTTFVQRICNAEGKF